MWGPHQTFQTEHVNKTIRAVRIPLLDPTHSKQRQNRTLQLGDKKTKILLLGRRGEARPAFPFRKKIGIVPPFYHQKLLRNPISLLQTRERKHRSELGKGKKKERERERSFDDFPFEHFKGLQINSRLIDFNSSDSFFFFLLELHLKSWLWFPFSITSVIGSSKSLLLLLGFSFPF